MRTRIDNSRLYPDGEARANRVISITLEQQTLLHPEYELRLLPGKTLRRKGEGVLWVFKLLPKRKDLPSFRGRWDNEADTVDIDGWHHGHHFTPPNGHWPKKVSDEPRKYVVDLNWNEQPIFQGTIGFLWLEKELHKKVENVNSGFSMQKITMGKEISVG